LPAGATFRWLQSIIDTGTQPLHKEPLESSPMPNIAIRTLVILFLIAGYAFAQEAQPQAPDAAEAQPALQHARERYRLVSRADEVVTVLDNGLTIIARRLPSPVLTVRGYVRTGGMYEGKWLGGGLSHLLEHLVAGGSTEKRT